MSFRSTEVIPLPSLPGVGAKTAARLNALGVREGRDLLFLLPRAYQDRTHPRPISALEIGRFATLRGQVLTLRERRYRTRKTLEILVTDGHGVVVLKWFRYGRWLLKAMERKHPPGAEILVSGRVDSFSGALEMHHPDIAGTMEDQGAGIVPVYPLTEGISQHVLRRAVRGALDTLLGTVEETIPREILERYGLPSLVESLSCLHAPPPDVEVEALNLHESPWHRRLKFGELLAFQLGLLARRRELDVRDGNVVSPPGVLQERLLQLLPFAMTGAQHRVLEEITGDMAARTPMHRLLQGEVGSGKTLVAFLAMLRACEAGFQAVMMAPTEVLAEQHYRTFTPWCRHLQIPMGLLTGSVGGQAREQVLAGASEGSIRLFVGTHALIQEGIQFQSIALAVVDEQHRFGVLQRLTLKAKGLSPHFLVMTATPIPRSLSMVLYGDLDISTIDELPVGRRPVETLLFREEDRSRMHLRVSREAEAGRQVYIVYPLVEESEKVELLAAQEMALHYRDKVFPHLRIGLLTGRMASRDKERVMERFRSGEYQVLVATTVIEVGVDVPNASLMVIEHAERFGLFQLHQLRGRVGRGAHASQCILMQGPDASGEARQRLEVVAGTNSGFRIAEADLRFRGPGDFLGVRQAGLPDFRYAHPLRERELMTMAREAALEILPPGARLGEGMSEEIRRLWPHGGDVATAG